MNNIDEHFDDGECLRCGKKIKESDFVQLYNGGKWIDFGTLKDSLRLLYETDEIRHKNCANNQHIKNEEN